MKRFALAIALACVLSGSALAGDIHGADAPAPADIHTPGYTASAPGDVHTGGEAAAPGEMGNGVVVGDMGNGAALLLTILALLY